jgi:hypothetical protein
MDESPYQGDEAAEVARKILRGRRPKILNACGIADVIDELTKFQLEAMQTGDYRQGEAIYQTICSLRRDYREKDRLNYQETRVLSLKEKLQLAERRLSEKQKKSVCVLTTGRKRARSDLRWKRCGQQRTWTQDMIGKSCSLKGTGRPRALPGALVREARPC